MRVIKYGVLNHMASPIGSVMRNIHNALVNIAPEREEEFCNLFVDFVLEYRDTPEWECSVDVASKYIYLSRKVVEVMWVASLVYFRLYEEVQRKGLGTAISFVSNPRLHESTDLFKWALETWFQKDSKPWPPNLPQPVPNESADQEHRATNEFCLCAVAYLLHHEFAHIRLLHNGMRDVESERDADYQAANWILGKVKEDSPEFKKRALGVSVALGILAAKGIHTGEHGGKTHPRGFDRLFNTFDRHILDPNHVVWFFIVAMLTLHLDNAGLQRSLSKGPFSSARACANSYVEALSRDTQSL